MENLEFDLLQPQDIDVKVNQVGEGWASLLLYKNARTDMNALDEKVGPMNWQDQYADIKGVLYCGISIKNSSGEWITKWDCGIESREDKGNEKKGEASDAFKRACTKWGHGRELYTSPPIFITIETKESKGVQKIADKKIRFDVSKITYEDKTIKELEIINNYGEVVFSSNKPKKQAPKTSKKGTEKKSVEDNKTADKTPKEEVKTVVDETPYKRMLVAHLKEYGDDYADIVKNYMFKMLGKTSLKELSEEECKQVIEACEQKEGE